MLDERKDASGEVARANERIKTLHDNGNHKEALALATRTVEYASKQLGQTHPLTIVSLGNLAVELKWMGHLQDAKNVYEKLLELHETTGTQQTEFYARTLNNLAELYVDAGDDTTAEALHAQALTILESTLPADDPTIADSLSNLAQIYGRQGRYTDAERLLRRALSIDEQTVGTGHFVYALHLGNLAAVLHALGQHAGSLRLLRRALDIIYASMGRNHHLFADTLCKVASINRTIGDYTEAERLYREALEIQHASLGRTIRVAGTLDQLASLYTEMGKRREAEAVLAQAQHIRTARGQPDDSLSSLVKRAQLSSTTGDLDAAESLFRQVAEIEETMGDNYSPLAATLNNLAEVLKHKGNVHEAEALYQRALTIQLATSGADHPNHATIQHNLAMLYAATERPGEALKLMTAAEIIAERQLGQIFSMTSERQRLNYLGEVTDRATCLLSLVTQHFPRDPVAVRVAFDLVLRRKGITAEALASQRTAIFLGRYPAVAAKLRELSELKGRIAEDSWANPETQAWGAQKQRVEELRSRTERLEMEVAQEVAETDITTLLQTINTETVAAAFSAEAVLVEFAQCDSIDFHFRPTQTQSARGPTHYLAFVLPAKRPEELQMVDLGETWPIDQRIAKFRSFLSDGGEETKHASTQQPAWPTGDPGRNVGDELRSMLLDPIHDAIRHHRRLFIAPIGDLTRLPFQVLPLDEHHYLTDAFNIGYFSAGRDAIRLATTAGTGNHSSDPIVIADPDFSLKTSAPPVTRNQEAFSLRTVLSFWKRNTKDRSSQQPSTSGELAGAPTTSPASEPGGEPPSSRHSRDLHNRNLTFNPLPGTRLEGKRVGTLLGVEPWLGDAALKSRVRRCRSPRVLHVATHGFFLADQQRNAGEGSPPNPHETHQITGDFAGSLQGPGMESPLLRSGLALAGANTWLAKAPLPPDAENGLLTAEEVSGLDLSSTELITLSDCDTGLGELHGSEGVFGLRRSCLVAGARTLVMSLWKLPDLATAILMVHFYEHLREGYGRCDALQLAQDHVRKTTISDLRGDWLRPEIIEELAGGDKRQRQYLNKFTALPDDARPFEHPYHWGAFICEGDHRPLPWYAHGARERKPDFTWETLKATAREADTASVGPAAPVFRLLDPANPFALPNGVSPEIGLVVSPDSRHVAYAVRDAQGMHVELDGRPFRRYDRVFGLELANAALAYGAAREGRMFVVFNEREDEVWDDIGRSSPVISPDGRRVAYSARRGNWWYVIIDGVVVGGPYEGLGPGGVLFSPNSLRYAYVVKQGESWHAVVDGVDDRAFPTIAERSLSFSPDSAKVAYVGCLRGHRAGAAFVGEAATVVNGVTGRAWRVDEVTRQSGLSGELYFSPDATRLVYTGLQNGASFVVVDDQVHGSYDGLLSGWKTRADGKPPLHHHEKMGTIAFSPDSRRIAYAAQLGNQAVAVVLPRTQRPFTHDRILNQPPLFSPDSQHLAYGVEQHLEQGVAIDGRVRWAYSGLPPAAWSFSPDSTILAYVAWHGSGRDQSLGCNGVDLHLGGGLVVNSSIIWDDNEHLHCLVGDGQRIWTQTVVVEGDNRHGL